ncbi:MULTISPECIES: winged helix-turn-helix transcriptional regulator [unclassified Sphingobacterium]|uniref:winged helix-turn-helix transcriptional regulator n=1 Tax=unclassified Sphingobacterium TaxID=2609468 RepID=UPI0025D6FCE8|nr:MULTISPECIES: helix-turn-helix domain-containing protein [unclassified Sphingobacterium]
MINKEEKKVDNYSKLQQSFLLKSNLDTSCILNQSLALIANKWTLLTLMALMQGIKRTNELQKQINDISPKMLNETLKRLVDYGMVQRKVYPEVPPRVEYRLTSFGKSTADPLAALLDWSVENEETLRSLFERLTSKD